MCALLGLGRGGTVNKYDMHFKKVKNGFRFEKTELWDLRQYAKYTLIFCLEYLSYLVLNSNIMYIL